MLIFKDGELELEVNVSPEGDTVWLNQNDISALFEKERSVITKHIRNIFNEEELVEKSNVQFLHIANSDKPVKVYNLDVIISVGYRVKSKRGVAFRKWANSVLKEYILKGYSINQNKLLIPDYSQLVAMLETYRKFDGQLNITSDDLLGFLVAYEKGLKILDDYDHQSIEVVGGRKDTYRLNYDECIDVIKKSTFKDKGDLFAVELNDSFKASISTIYQTFDGNELYPTLELKAANLLYFITKNHSFVDGNKRIAATIFLYFMERNKALEINKINRISNETLATLTILIASSNPGDQEIIVNLIQLLISF